MYVQHFSILQRYHTKLLSIYIFKDVYKCPNFAISNFLWNYRNAFAYISFRSSVVRGKFLDTCNFRRFQIKKAQVVRSGDGYDISPRRVVVWSGNNSFCKSTEIVSFMENSLCYINVGKMYEDEKCTEVNTSASITKFS